MADNNNNNTNNEHRGVNFSFRIDPAIYAAISSLAIAEDRSMANVVNRALKSSPEIMAAMETNIAADSHVN